MSVSINQTGSRWEGFVDNFMDGVDNKITAFEKYAKSPVGQNRIAQVQIMSTLASAVILAQASPVIVGVSAGVGVVIRSFSPEQVESIQEKLGRITDSLPSGVKILAVVIAVTFARVLFPVTAGLYLGLEFGRHISPHTLAKGADKLAVTSGYARELHAHDYVYEDDEDDGVEDMYVEVRNATRQAWTSGAGARADAVLES